MATKTLNEQRAAAQKKVDDAQRGIDEIDLVRAQQALEIFERPEMLQAIEDLKALTDEGNKSGLQRAASADVDALIANLLVPMINGPEIAKQHIERLDKALNPPPEPPAAPAPAALPAT